MNADISRRALISAAAFGACAPAGMSRAAAQPDQDIHLGITGEGPASWVLLQPFCASGRLYEARAAALAAEHGARMISPDLPSHGRSRIVQRWGYDDATFVIEAALAPYRDTISIYVGASSGGLIALKLAARAGKPAAAIGVGAHFTPENVAEMAATARHLPEDTRVNIDAFLEQGDPQRAAIQRHFGDLAAVGEAPLMSAQENAALAHRAFIINGAADDFFLPPSAHALANAIPGAQLTFVTGAAHLEPLAPQYRDFTWGSIATFLRTRA